jgi:hypothetical protein
MMTRRMKVSLVAGAILGVVCIIGASARSGLSREAYWLFSLWYNRLLMGFVIGLPWMRIALPKTLFRGALIGTVVSFAFYSATGFTDFVSFLAGIVYGVLIEYCALKFGETALYDLPEKEAKHG